MRINPQNSVLYAVHEKQNTANSLNNYRWMASTQSYKYNSFSMTNYM